MSLPRRTFLLVLLTAYVRSAAASVDLTGTWTVYSQSGAPSSWSIVQSGTSISVTVSGNTFTGPIDPDTGQFSFVAPGVPCPSGVSATASSNDAFSGALTDTSPSCPGGPHSCTCVPSQSYGLNGCRDGAAGACCGDAVMDAGEQCDPGPQFLGCCDGLCQLAAVMSICVEEGNACTDDLCDGAGTCTHPASASGQSCPDDGDVCTADTCDGGGACIHSPLPDTDGDGTCDAADLCTSTATIDSVRAVLVGLTTPAIDDDVFTLRTRLTLAALPSPPIDPSQTGLRVIRLNADGSAVYDRTIVPGGAWISNDAGTVFRFRADNIRVRLATAANDPRRVKLKWRDADPFAVQPVLPIAATVMFDPFASTETCADISFASCSLNGVRAVCR
jgi:hypothetical protein